MIAELNYEQEDQSERYRIGGVSSGWKAMARTVEVEEQIDGRKVLQLIELLSVLE
jgi:hypothetical protein